MASHETSGKTILAQRREISSLLSDIHLRQPQINPEGQTNEVRCLLNYMVCGSFSILSRDPHDPSGVPIIWLPAENSALATLRTSHAIVLLNLDNSSQILGTGGGM